MRLGGLQRGIGGRLEAGVPAREDGGAVRGPELTAARISGVGSQQVLDLALDRDRGRVVGVSGGVVAVGDQHPGVVAVVEADAERLRGLTIATDVPAWEDATAALAAYPDRTVVDGGGVALEVLVGDRDRKQT